MKVKIKGKTNLDDVVGFSSQTILPDNADSFFNGSKPMVVPVVIIVLRNTTKVEVHPVQDIEELHK